MASPIHGFTISATPSASIAAPTEVRATLRQKISSHEFKSTVSWGIKQYEFAIDIPLEKSYESMSANEKKELEDVVGKYKEAFMENFKKEAEKNSAIQPGMDFDIAFTEEGYTASIPTKQDTPIQITTPEAKHLSKAIRSGSVENIKKEFASSRPPANAVPPQPPVSVVPLPKRSIECGTQTATITLLAKNRTFGTTTFVFGVGKADEQSGIKIPLSSNQLTPQFFEETLEKYAKQGDKQITFSMPDTWSSDTSTIIGLRDTIIRHAGKAQNTPNNFEKIQLIINEKQRKLLNRSEVTDAENVGKPTTNPPLDFKKALLVKTFGDITYVISWEECGNATQVCSSNEIEEILKNKTNTVELLLNVDTSVSNFKETAQAIDDAIILRAGINQNDQAHPKIIKLIVTEEQKNMMFPPSRLESHPVWDKARYAFEKQLGQSR